MSTLKRRQKRALATLALTASVGLSIAGAAAPVVTTGGVGSQVNTIAAEGVVSPTRRGYGNFPA